MTKMIWKINAVFHDEKRCLEMMIGILIALPILYMVYLTMSAHMLKVSMGTLLQENPGESINLVAMLTSFYIAYVVLQYRNARSERSERISFLLVFLAQILLFNQIGIVIFALYVYHFIGLKHLKKYSIEGHGKVLSKTFAMAILALLVAAVIFWLRLRVGFV